MDSKIIWNRIVEQHQKNFNEQETVVQKEWESIFTAFGYSSFFGEIDSHRTIHIGSGKTTIPDIIIKDGKNDLFDVELKQYNLPFDKKMEEQLLSYMKLLEVSVGLLICKELYIYTYIEKNVKWVKIDFTENNPDGEKFVELFTKGNFSRNDIETFIDSKNNFEKHIEEIKDEFFSLDILDLVKKHFKSNYLSEEIEKAFERIRIEVIDRDPTTDYPPHDPPPISPPQNVYNEPEFDYVIIKTSDKWVNIRGSLYEATRREWRAGERITQYTFVLSVINQIVQAVYIVDRWNWVPDKKRWEFFGREATGPKFDELIGKTIPEKYRKPGMASPIVYKKAP